MPKRTTLPPAASVASEMGDGRLFAPAAARNAYAIADVLCRHLPPEGRALEIASGTGQHVTHLAAALPGWQWHPSEIDADRRASIDAHTTEVTNVSLATQLDATAPGWGAVHPGQDLILVVNLLHLISAPEVQTLLGEARAVLAPGGTLAIYGPFLRDGIATSDGDARFHASLRASDPEIGYKDAGDIERSLAALNLSVIAIEVMPANNLFFLARAP